MGVAKETAYKSLILIFILFFLKHSMIHLLGMKKEKFLKGFPILQSSLVWENTQFVFL